MTGTLVYVMGPSGSGKDSLIAYIRKSINASYAQTWNSAVHTRKGLRPIFFSRRYITRPANAGEERHYCLTREEFRFRKNSGGFALSWESHGLCYGIGSEIDMRLAVGAIVVVNGSREYLPEATKKYPALVPVLVSARPDVLRERLEKRGRENAKDIDERLGSAVMKLPDIPGLIELDNSGAFKEAGRKFSDIFLRLRRETATQKKEKRGT